MTRKFLRKRRVLDEVTQVGAGNFASAGAGSEILRSRLWYNRADTHNTAAAIAR